MSKLYNKIEVVGVITYIDYKVSKNGKQFVKGIIATYEEKDAKKMYYTSLSYMGFEEIATQFEVNNIKIGDTIRITGKLQQSMYQEKTYLNLIVDDLSLDVNSREEQPKVKPQPKKEIPLNPELALNDDDFPF